MKAPPLYPPWTVYENDQTVNTNNLINSLFKFAYSFIYDDNEESVRSVAFTLSLPTTAFTAIENWSISVCARIGVFVETGDVNIKKINLYMTQTQNGSTSNWFLVDTIDKSALSVPNNSIYKYLFYNTGNYTVADPALLIDQQDWVPDYAGAQAVINGNTLLYGDIIEGYDWFKSIFSMQANLASNQQTIPGFLFFAAFDGTFTAGQPNIKLTVTGSGPSPNIGGLAVDVSYPPQNLYVYANSDVSGDISFSATGTFIPDSISHILGLLQTAATGAGWSVAAPTDINSIRIYYPTGNYCTERKLLYCSWRQFIYWYSTHYHTKACTYRRGGLFLRAEI